MVAQELAIRHPDQVERLVLCCTSSGGAGAPSYPLHTLTDLPDEERLATQLGISDTVHCEGGSLRPLAEKSGHLFLLQDRRAWGVITDWARATP